LFGRSVARFDHPHPTTEMMKPAALVSMDLPDRARNQQATVYASAVYPALCSKVKFSLAATFLSEDQPG
jgi:hypothetical protein